MASQPRKQTQAKSEPAPTRKDALESGKPLELEAPVESKISENAVAGGGQGNAGQQNSGVAKGGAADTNKAVDTKALELQARVEKLEQQLNMMQQLLSLKDQQLAALQNANKAPANAQPSPAEKPKAPESQQPVPSANPQSPVVQQPPAETVVKPAPPTLVAPTPTPKPTAPVAPQPVAAPPAEDFFASDSYYLTVGGLAAGLLSIFGWIVWRKRKIEEQINSESMFANASQITMPDPESVLSVPVLDLDNSSAYDVGTVGESSFISDFTPSDFDAFDTDQSEVDPLSEADVYLAYARYQQAEELIRSALEQEPDKDSFKLKLLEIFYAGENKKKFSDYARSLADSGKQNDPVFWGKVTEMAREIVPESSLFSLGAGPSAVVATVGEEEPESKPVSKPEPAPVSEAPADFGAEPFGYDDYDLDNINSFSSQVDFTSLEDLSDEFAELENDSDISASAHDNSLEFDTSPILDSATGVSNKNDSMGTPEKIESIDFDLGKLSDEKPKEKVGPKESQSLIDSFEFDFNLDKFEALDVSTKTKPAEKLDLDKHLELELDDNSKSKPSEHEKVTPITGPITATDEALGEFDFNFDFGTPDIQGKAGFDEFDLSVSDLTDMDEFETKIDLAKAYLDMGDAESAKMIAEEVRTKGTKEQQALAQSLLDELK